MIKTRSTKTTPGVGKPLRKLRVLIAKVGLDGHDRGVKIVARALRDAGMEVIYLGIHNTPEEIASSALQEDVDAIGLSIHSAAHMTLFSEVLGLLKKNKARDIAVFGGGIVPQEDIHSLKKMGVKAIFTPGAPLEEIVDFVKSIKITRRNARHAIRA
jgi:methylmalonyl-CoA mutase C-terminal domain/subunit